MSIWIDVTDLMAWKGHLTGIQRVVYNIASRLQRDSSEIKFFYYDPKPRQFFEIHIDLAEWLRVNDEQSKTETTSLKSKLVNVVPHRVKRVAPRPVKHAVVVTGKYVISKGNKLRQIKNRNDSGADKKKAEFLNGDKALVLGNGWDNQNIILDLGVIKQTTGIKIVNVVYDLIPIFEPQYFGGLVTAQYANYTFEAIANCDLLLPISKSTEKDIERFCKLIDAPKPKTSVIRLGDEIAVAENVQKPKWLKHKKFILCVGTIEIRKNHTLLYYALKRLVKEGKEIPNLVIVGKKGWYTGDILMLFEQDLELREHIQIVENASDEDLSWLYENCQFTVYPSLYEGWGLPVAESLARGKVVVCSDSSSVPEAGGELAEYFSPYDPVALGDLILKFINSENLKNKEKNIIKNYKITTWEDCYKQVVSFLSKI